MRLRRSTDTRLTRKRPMKSATFFLVATGLACLNGAAAKPLDLVKSPHDHHSSSDVSIHSTSLTAESKQQKAEIQVAPREFLEEDRRSGAAREVISVLKSDTKKMPSEENRKESRQYSRGAISFSRRRHSHTSSESESESSSSSSEDSDESSRDRVFIGGHDERYRGSKIEAFQGGHDTCNHVYKSSVMGL